MLSLFQGIYPSELAIFHAGDACKRAEREKKSETKLSCEFAEVTSKSPGDSSVHGSTPGKPTASPAQLLNIRNLEATFDYTVHVSSQKVTPSQVCYKFLSAHVLHFFQLIPVIFHLCQSNTFIHIQNCIVG